MGVGRVGAAFLIAAGLVSGGIACGSRSSLERDDLGELADASPDRKDTGARDAPPDSRPDPDEPCGAASGELDPSFGDGGITFPLFVPPRPPAGADKVFASARAVAVRPSGEILVLGDRQYSDGVFRVLVQFLPDGTLDATFGTEGIVRLGVPGARFVLQPDGGVVVAFGVSASQCGIVRYTADGQPDASLTGSVSFSQGPGTVTGLALAPDDKFVFGGWARTGTTKADPDELFVSRILGGGGSDPQLTLFTTGLPLPRGLVVDLAVQADGAIVSAGTTYKLTGDDPAVAFLTRVTADGALDPSFGAGGRVLAPFAELVSSVAATDAGIYLAGRSIVDGYEQPMVARFRQDGSLDPTFAKGGFGLLGLGDMTMGHVEAIRVLPDGQSVGLAMGEMKGLSGAYASVFRMTSDGTLDSAFGQNGASALTSVTSYGTFDMAVQANGRIVVAGGRTNESGYTDMMVARICP